jgi:hypothetical protein
VRLWAKGAFDQNKALLAYRLARGWKGVLPGSFWAAHVNRQNFRFFLVTGFEHTAPSTPILSRPLRVQLGCERLSKGLETAESFTERCPRVFMVQAMYYAFLRTTSTSESYVTNQAERTEEATQRMPSVTPFETYKMVLVLELAFLNSK